MRRAYGAPGAVVERAAVYPSDGVAFLLSPGQVRGIFVFRPRTMPSGLRP
jgi:hypothetical protein